MDRIRKTKIVCTIGPSSGSVFELKRLVAAGMDVARFNCSHGDHEQYLGFIRNIRTASKDVALMFDTQGPEIRTGMLKTEVVLRNGQEFILTTDYCIGDSKKVQISYEKFPKEVYKNDAIMIDDGIIELKVLRVKKNNIICKVIHGGILGNRKGVNHPGRVSKLPSVTKKDVRDIKFGLKYGIDFVAASFTRCAKDILTLKKVLKGYEHVKIIAKIECRQAVDNIDEIIDIADGVMVARGDLGVEIPQEEVPLVQKMIIRKCNLAGKPVITATQMLESMISNPRPTRAEANDVANAILDGTDSIMLSGETAMGKYPEGAVKMMAKIAKQIEPYVSIRCNFQVCSISDAMAKAIFSIVNDTGINKIIVATRSGYSARIITKYRPKANIITVTPNEHTAKQLNIIWGALPLIVSSKHRTPSALVHAAVEKACKEKLVSKKENIIVFTIRKNSNILEIHKVGDFNAKKI